MVQRNIAPDIAIEIDQDGVKARDTVKQFRNIIMRFNLGGVRIPLDAQRGDELFAELMPVNFRIGGDMRVIVAYGAVNFTEDLHRLSWRN